jgi:hypothetical protein
MFFLITGCGTTSIVPCYAQFIVPNMLRKWYKKHLSILGNLYERLRIFMSCLQPYGNSSNIIPIISAMTDNPKFEQLYLLLDKAVELAEEFTGGYSNHFFSAQEFHAALAESIAKLKAGDTDQLNDLWLWFAPTYDWDDFIHQDGQDLANEIFPLLTDLRNELNVYTIVDLINDYQEKVNRVMDAFKQEFNRTDLLTALRHDKIYPQVGKLKKYNIKRYAFHGIGLAVYFDDNTSVDFDFAFLPEQRHDGFDLWRLSDFVSSRPNKYKKYLDKKKLEDDFNKLIERGAIINPDVTLSTSLYFFKSVLTQQEVTKSKTEKAWWKFW